MKSTIKVSNLILFLNTLVLFIILISEICFYTIDNIKLYRTITITSLLISFIINFSKYSLKKSAFKIWVTILFALYIFYGQFFLAKGIFSIYTIVFRYLEIIIIYNTISYIIDTDINKIFIPFVLAGFFSLIYLLTIEKFNFLSGNIRIGDSLSGNVNTAGFHFGIISMMIMWWYVRNKKFYKIIFFIIFAFVMLVTGSKKILIILFFDMFLLFIMDKSKINKWIKILLAFCFVLYLIFEIPYFYNIIGFRIETMIGTLLHSENVAYSYSTDVRNNMIHEGIKIFLTKPVFGGGWNYFYSKTIYGYEYSHNNYIELLCSFGLVGFLYYYSLFINNILISIKHIKNKISINFDCVSFAFILICATLFLEYGMVTFSAQCTYYLPIIIASILNKKIIKDERMIFNEQN